MQDTSKPVYLKLRDKIAAAIIDGTYAEGGMLPSVRAFAAQEGANPLTVAKAYQQFQNGLMDRPDVLGLVDHDVRIAARQCRKQLGLLLQRTVGPVAPEVVGVSTSAAQLLY